MSEQWKFVVCSGQAGPLFHSTPCMAPCVSRLMCFLVRHFPPMQAKITQQANLAAGKRAPPVWAMAAILLLGWNEFVAVVWNPIYLIFGFLFFMFSWMLYAELDVDARMQQGWVAGALGIWGSLGDALRTVSAEKAAMSPCMEFISSLCGGSIRALAVVTVGSTQDLQETAFSSPVVCNI